MATQQEVRQQWHALQACVVGVKRAGWCDQATLNLRWKEGTARTTRMRAWNIMRDGGLRQAFLAGEGSVACTCHTHISSW